MSALDAIFLPSGIRARLIPNINDMTVHVLEAGFETPGRPAVLLLHGFPELAYSWRKVMLPLARAGYHVIAPDARGYGRSSGTDVKHGDDLRPFGTRNKIVDNLALLSALGYRSVDAVVGHDQGSPIAGWCALSRPDVFKSVVMMSSPFRGAPGDFPFDTANNAVGSLAAEANPDEIHQALAELDPPRKYYMRYYTTPSANENMWRAKQGLHAFLRAYYHMKSADWIQNKPFPLQALIASEWEKLPRYYVMDLAHGMAESVAAEMPSAEAIARCTWLPDDELRVYSSEYGRTGFQGGLQGYRIGPIDREVQIFAGLKITVPSMFIGGESDWGVYQTPGGLAYVEHGLTTCYQGTHLVEGAGHWVQQEQPEKVCQLLLEFLSNNR